MSDIIKSRPCFTTRITSSFGYRNHPLTKRRTMHNGIDLAPSDKVKYFQEPICSVGLGIVKSSYLSNVLGNAIVIQHDGGIESRYYHLAKRLVSIGDIVTTGNIIGLMGSTGDSTAQHLHFEIRINGKAVDPFPYIDGLEYEGGNDSLTKDEIKKIVNEVLKESGDEPSDWAKKDWLSATKSGITDGTRPKAFVTREEVIVMLQRMFNK